MSRRYKIFIGWLIAVILAGIAAGVIGGATSLLIVCIETFAFGVAISHTANGVAGIATWRLILSATLGGLLSGLAWYWLRPKPKGQITTVSDATANCSGTLPRLPSIKIIIDALGQLLVVGTGTSLGREAAPRQLAALSAQWFSDLFKASPELRRALLASAAGAGLAAVYNVPLAGALYALEIRLKPDLRTKKGWLQIGIAIITSIVATMVSWIFNKNNPIYKTSHLSPSFSMIPLSVLVGLTCLAVGAIFGMAISRIKSVLTPTKHLFWSVPLGSLTVILMTLLLPQIPGNGQIIVQSVLGHQQQLTFLLGLGISKIIATLVALRSGASGGLLTPALSVGACCGASLAILSGYQNLSEVSIFAIIGAGCLLAITQQAPIFALAFAAELTNVSLPVIELAAIAMAVTWIGFLGVSYLAKKLLNPPSEKP